MIFNKVTEDLAKIIVNKTKNHKNYKAIIYSLQKLLINRIEL